MEDIQVIQCIQAGDTEAFAVLVSRYHRNLLNFIYRLVRDEALVEDLGQEIFLDAFRGLRDFDPHRGVPFAAWLFILARNRCISEVRARTLRNFVDIEGIPEPAGSIPDAEELFLAGERREALRRSLEQLPEPFRETILQSLAGKSLEEIAAKDGVSLGTVKSRLFRAKEGLKALMGQIYRRENNGRI
ncbi:RNA polymerase sigma factor [Geotalea daltonii FRC-32]|uniref:RNA polymerase sigma factor n=1 Tax=Geotalea daltonii (strain DSM 22248 / JCM 15807 / FRC-32) TaxID=316067 RepID=B9M8T5_GEODF|nr:sigma-70 family RNA polymerase sigma factor [Geotalea daltonii]ACM20431.1 RNA polymerase sigma factor [Geotalea daltonii FRC-32]